MVDLAFLQSVSYMVGALGVGLAAIYYIFTLRINMKTQQLTLKSQEQTLETLINEKALLFTKYLKGEKKDSTPRVPDSLQVS